MRAKSIALAAIAALVLTGCGQTSAPASGADEGAAAGAAQEAGAPSYQLSCADFANATFAGLQQRFGAENVADQTLDGPEGEQYKATVVFADDPARRFEVNWAEGAQHQRPQNVIVDGEGSLWEGPSGLRVDMTLAELQAANGGPFDVSGFGWDYGGRVTDWRGGVLSQASCTLFVGLSPEDDAAGAQGDAIFSSDSAAMAGANAHVSEFGLGFAQQ